MCEYNGDTRSAIQMTLRFLRYLAFKFVVINIAVKIFFEKSNLNLLKVMDKSYTYRGVHRLPKS